MRVIWSPLAIERAYEAAAYIAGDKPKAAEFYRRFLKAWENADKDLPAVREASEWLKNNS